MDRLRLALPICGVIGSFALMLYGGYLSYGWWGVATPFLIGAALAAAAWVALPSIPDWGEPD